MRVQFPLASSSKRTLRGTSGWCMADVLSVLVTLFLHEERVCSGGAAERSSAQVEGASSAASEDGMRDFISPSVFRVSGDLNTLRAMHSGRLAQGGANLR